eukprot:gnl/MRDRNA2_/MRDRNA2_98161_c0_seq1.p1 gnl/MRDRNA2_/MRDRNA2_98161_c0~~gnl/MRDRNA2_/MRDRNA2_98161_c0_seq1.p1  ORF type:complete len:396 (+),score=78.93 gnl/MRDRNA2_/MRDRNA2_98161_c0_seq1:111-1298(+)
MQQMQNQGTKSFRECHEIDQDALAVISEFKAWADLEFGGAGAAFTSFHNLLDFDNSLELTCKEWQKACKAFGYPGDGKELFHKLDADQTGLITLNKIEFIEKLIFPEGLQDTRVTASSHFRQSKDDKASAMRHKNQIKDEQLTEFDALSDTSTTCSSGDDVQQLEPLLWVSEPKFEGESTQHVAVSMGRCNKQLRFGITFEAKEDGRIVIADDAAHLGIAKGDMLLSISGGPHWVCRGTWHAASECKNLTHEKCKRILDSALRIDLTLLRVNARHFHWPISKQTKWSNREGIRCVNLLAASPLMPDEGLDSFTLKISRASHEQQIGLCFRSMKWREISSGQSLTSEVYIAEDAPHLGLKQGDRILKLNGSRVLNFGEFEKSLHACMTVNLLVKRE